MRRKSGKKPEYLEKMTQKCRIGFARMYMGRNIKTSKHLRKRKKEPEREGDRLYGLKSTVRSGIL